MKRILTAVAAAALVFSAAACAAQNTGDYPVSVARYTIRTKPVSVVCLSDSVADIIISCGYSDAVKGITDECTQQELEGASVIGSKADPSVKKIEELSPDVVFADKSVNQAVLKTLEKDGVCVLNMITAQNGKQLDTLYSSIGAVMAGNTDGRKTGASKAQSLMTTMSDLQRVVPETEVLPVACYLYDEKCTPAPTTTFCGKLFEYAGAVNAFSMLQQGEQSEATYETSYYAECLKLGDVSYIFCDTGVKDKLMENPDLAGITAIKNGNVYEIDANIFERQGSTVTDTLSFMIETMYPELASGDTESKAEESKAEESKPEESKAEESKAEESKPKEESRQESKTEESSAVKVEADDSLEITEDLHFEKGTLYDEFDKVQQRLANLGYYDPDDGFTGFFGDKSEAAYKAFQKGNGLKADGKVTTEGLKLLFSADVKPAAAA